MELGQQVCLGPDPRCGSCPLARGCVARAAGLQRDLPPLPRAGRQRQITRESVVLIHLQGDAVCLCPHARGLFHGLWTFPRVAPEEAPGSANATGGSPRSQERRASRLLGELRPRTHAYVRTRERLLPRVYAGRAPGGCGCEWVPLAALAGRPMPSAHRRIADELLERLAELTGR